MANYFNLSFKILSEVIKDGSYSNIALNNNLNDVDKASDKAIVTKIVYGVLEKEKELNDIVLKEVTKKPKPNIMLILMISAYIFIYMDNLPDYAVVNNAATLAKDFNKGYYTSLVNAVARKLSRLRGSARNNDLSCPVWLKNKLVIQYGVEKTEEILKISTNNLTHIRPNFSRISAVGLAEMLLKRKIDFNVSPINGFYVKVDDFIKKLFEDGRITYQSPSSMLAVYAMDLNKGDKLLDLCSSPGGKAVLAVELYEDIKVTACDIHPHRVELIKKYAKRMRLKGINTEINDATVINNAFFDAYDCVLCDVLCSGTGSIKKKPDIMRNKKEEDIKSLNKTQLEIISNGALYVKCGGSLIYSTCSILNEENLDIVNKFMENNTNFALDKIHFSLKNADFKDNNGIIELLPDKDWEGFFIARLKRIR